MPRARRDWSTMRPEIRRLLRETDETAPYWANALLLDLFNQAMDEWSMFLNDQHEGWNTVELTADLVAGQREYELPEGTGRIRRVSWKSSNSGTTYQPLIRDERLSRAYYTASTGSSSSTNLPTYRLMGELLLLEPPPDAAVTGGLLIEADAVPARLTGDSSKLDLSFPAEMETLLIYETAVRALTVEGSQDAQQADYLLGLTRLRDSYAQKFSEFVANRAQSRVFGVPHNFGDT